MNIAETEEAFPIVAKKDVIFAELEACERLLKYASDEGDKKSVESEIAELKMALDLLT